MQMIVSWIDNKYETVWPMVIIFTSIQNLIQNSIDKFMKMVASWIENKYENCLTNGYNFLFNSKLNSK